MHGLDAAVGALMRDVAATAVMPMFRDLAADQIEEKTPGDLVTVADRLAEARLAEALPSLAPGSRVIGEEAVAADPTLLDGIEQGLVWIVDPIDGTGNFAAGHSPFAIMIAMARDGIVEAGWILDPVTGRMVHAVRGGGAFIDGVAVTARSSGAARPIASITTRFLPPALRDAMIGRITDRLTEATPPLCAGEQYPRLVLGQHDIALYWRANPWDHAAGGLFLTEAGGRLAHFDGTPYRIGSGRTGLLAAASPALWDEAAAILFA